MSGRVDRVDRVGADGVAIIDYKTGKPKTQKDADDSLQLSLYALAAKEAWGMRADRLVFHNLEDNTAVVTTRDECAIWKPRSCEGAQDSRGHRGGKIFRQNRLPLQLLPVSEFVSGDGEGSACGAEERGAAGELKRGWGGVGEMHRSFASLRMTTLLTRDCRAAEFSEVEISLQKTLGTLIASPWLPYCN